MIISSEVFEAYLKCPSKSWFRHRGEKANDSAYSQWVREQNESYRIKALKRFMDSAQSNDVIIAPSQPLNIKKAKWRLAANFVVQKDNLEADVHAIERLSSKNMPDQLIPIRFAYANKLSKGDKLLLAFDSLIFSEAFRHEIIYGKIIYGDDFLKSKVKVSLLSREVRKLNGRVAELLSNNTPPEIVLNRHCSECGFQDTCRKKAIEKDDLSLLAGMNEKERKKFKIKGIFTITQLSYTFRPRRRPKRLRDKREKYHHALKALAIREKKIHIIGNPEVIIDGTPIYLDVEAIPDRDFYYLIGMLIQNNDLVAQHNLWADNPKDEETIWHNFLAILSSIQKPVLLHYGSFESNFLKHMCERYGGPPVDKFFRILDHSDYQSEVAIKCKERLDKNRDKLFTFLKYDGVPWNNNNAEHAIKAFARLRDVISGISTEKGTEEYLTLLSICQTCKYSGIDFLDFMRSGEKSL